MVLHVHLHCRQERFSFIKAKYVEHKYAIITCSDKEDLKQDLKQAILTHDISALLQVYAEGIDLMTILPDCVSIYIWWPFYLTVSSCLFCLSWSQKAFEGLIVLNGRNWEILLNISKKLVQGDSTNITCTCFTIKSLTQQALSWCMWVWEQGS